MYRVIKLDGTELGMTDAIQYIKIGSSGSFAPCAFEDAVGIAFDSTPYNLVGHDDIDGADTVVVSLCDGGEKVNSIESTIKVLLGVAE